MSEALLDGVQEVAQAAGALLLHYFRRPLEVAYKGIANPVTEADTASERLIRDRLAALVPEAGFLGEESGGVVRSRGATWVVDPLDGTTNFSHGFPWFCVSIALVYDGKPQLGVVHHPITRECFAARRGGGASCNGHPIAVSTTATLADALLSTGFYYHKGDQLARQIATFGKVHEHVQAIRRPGSAALDLAYVAAGYFDGFWEEGLAPWDTAAGILLVEEARGRVTDYRGRPAPLGSAQTLASNGAIHDALVELLSAKGTPAGTHLASTEVASPEGKTVD